jgi:hypothetical protein
MSENSKRIFISCSDEDQDFARRLCGMLEHLGASTFLNKDVVGAGLWPESVRSEIESASALILVIPSRQARHRNNLLVEAGAAKILGKPVLAVLPPKRQSRSIELPTEIAGVLILDADRRSLENLADMLLQAVPDHDHYAELTVAR